MVQILPENLSPEAQPLVPVCDGMTTAQVAVSLDTLCVNSPHGCACSQEASAPQPGRISTPRGWQGPSGQLLQHLPPI